MHARTGERHLRGARSRSQRGEPSCRVPSRGLALAHVLMKMAGVLVWVLVCLGLVSQGDPAAATAGSGQMVAEARPLKRDELARQYGKTPSAPPLVNSDAPSHQPGRVDTFWVAEHGAAGHFQVEAELRLVTRHAYWYVQRGSTITEAALRMSSEAFEGTIYPAVRRAVGSEPFPGIDNDPRITILNGNVPGVAGYVSSADAYSRFAHPYSNEREMIYVNVRSVEPGTQSYLGVLAHEFTHLAHSGINQWEATWIKEGLAETISGLVLSDRRQSYGTFFGRPDLQLTAWREGPAGSEYYESASLFVRYFVDRFGEQALYPLLARAGRGIEGIDAFLAQMSEPTTFETLFTEWTVANLAGAASTSGIPRYQTPPLGSPRVQRLRAPAQLQETVAQFGADYYELVQPGAATVRFAGNASVAPAGTTPRSGQGMWHSGREDASVASLTRRLDLSGAPRAELSFWTWYDIEEDYDFAYVSVSTDDGESWSLLEASGMSRSQSSGNNLGAGFTGRSGGGTQPAWLPVTIDLSRYVGRPVLIRFSYITDDAVTRDGIALDDIVVNPLGVREGAEEVSLEWFAEGWSRLASAIPQRWSAQVVLFDGARAEVERLELGPDGRGTWSGSGRRLDRAVLVISGTTANTLEPASYSLELA